MVRVNAIRFQGDPPARESWDQALQVEYYVTHELPMREGEDVRTVSHYFAKLRPFKACEPRIRRKADKTLQSYYANQFEEDILVPVHRILQRFIPAPRGRRILTCNIPREFAF